MTKIDWYKWRQAYLRWFAESGIKDAADYLRMFGNDEFSNELEEDQKESINEIGLHGFERSSSNRNQNIAIISINPKLSLTFNKDLNQNTNYQLGKIDVGNTKLSQKEGPRLGLKWLITQSDKTVASYVDGIFEKLAEEDLLPKEFSPPKKDDVPELIDRIYYTNWFKYATLNEKKLSNWLESDGERSMDQVSDSEISGLLNNKYNKNKKIQNSLLKQEIQAVDPDLVLVLGSLPWTGFFYNDVEPYSDGSLTDSYPVKKTTYKVHGRPYRYSDSSGTSAKVIPFYHASSTGYAQNAPQYLDNPLRDTKRRLSEALKA